jgi:hypothetical protein
LNVVNIIMVFSSCRHLHVHVTCGKKWVSKNYIWKNQNYELLVIFQLAWRWTRPRMVPQSDNPKYVVVWNVFVIRLFICFYFISVQTLNANYFFLMRCKLSPYIRRITWKIHWKRHFHTKFKNDETAKEIKWKKFENKLYFSHDNTLKTNTKF